TGASTATGETRSATTRRWRASSPAASAAAGPGHEDDRHRTDLRGLASGRPRPLARGRRPGGGGLARGVARRGADGSSARGADARDRKSTRLNSSHVAISYAVFCLDKKK